MFLVSDAKMLHAGTSYIINRKKLELLDYSYIRMFVFGYSRNE